MKKAVSSEKQCFLEDFKKYYTQSLPNILKTEEELKSERQVQQKKLNRIGISLFVLAILCCFVAFCYKEVLSLRTLGYGVVLFLVFALACILPTYIRMNKTHTKMNHCFLDLIVSYFTDFENLKEEGGFAVYRALKQSELFGKDVKFSSEDCFITNVSAKHVLITEATVNLKEYLIMVLEVENKYFRPTMAPREGGIFKFIYDGKMIDVSFGENNAYKPIAAVSYEDIAKNKELFYAPFWNAFEELKQNILGSSVELAFFEDKLVLAIREDTNLFEPVQFDMQAPTSEVLDEIAWQIQSMVKFADLYDEQRDLLLKYAKDNKLDYKEITSHRFA